MIGLKLAFGYVCLVIWVWATLGPDTAAVIALTTLLGDSAGYGHADWRARHHDERADHPHLQQSARVSCGLAGA
jgi:hypothetical protein